MKTIAEQIADLEAMRVSKMADMEALTNRAIEEGRTKDAGERESFDDLKAEVKAIDSELVDLREQEELMKKTAKAVPATPGTQAVREVAVARNTQKLAPGIAFARLAGAVAHTKGDMEKAAAFVASRFPEMGEAAKALPLITAMGSDEFVKAAVAPGTTTASTWAAPLVQFQTAATDFIEFLRPQTIVGKIVGIRNVPFNTRVPRQTAGGSAYWVGEGAPKPVTSLAFDQVTLGPTKLATIAVISQELARFSSPSAEQLVRDSLAAAIIQQMDSDFINPVNGGTANIKPASITNGVTAIASTDDPRADVAALFAPFIAANLTPAAGVYIMSATTALALSLKLDAQGNRSFPEISMSGGKFMGLPVVVSEAVGNIIVLANASDLLLADDGQVSIDVSQEASLQMNDAPANPADATTVFRSLWQDNLIGIRAERFVNWTKARAASVQYLSGVAY